MEGATKASAAATASAATVVTDVHEGWLWPIRRAWTSAAGAVVLVLLADLVVNGVSMATQYLHIITFSTAAAVAAYCLGD